MTLQVVEKRPVGADICAVVLASPHGMRLPDWTPGAHIDLILPGGMVRQYSLCGDRWDAYTYRIGVLRESDGRGGSAFIHDQLGVGDAVEVGGPRNNFRIFPARRYVFLAGGIGITPLLPMIVHANRFGADWSLHYGARSRRSMAFLDELELFGDRVVLVPEDERGLIDLPSVLGPADEHTAIYACGPSGFLGAVESACATWRPTALRVERFVPEDTGPPARTEPFVVELARSGGEVVVEPGTSILQALRRIGIDVLASCERGVCGTCETSVLAGEPDARDSILDTRSQEAAETMFVCVSRSRSDRLVLDL